MNPADPLPGIGKSGPQMPRMRADFSKGWNVEETSCLWPAADPGCNAPEGFRFSPLRTECGEDTASEFPPWKIERPVPACYKQTVSGIWIGRLSA
jgi:hypothetical protein